MLLLLHPPLFKQHSKIIRLTLNLKETEVNDIKQDTTITFTVTFMVRSNVTHKTKKSDRQTNFGVKTMITFQFEACPTAV